MERGLSSRHIISPAIVSPKILIFLWRRCNRIGAVLALSGQMNWHIIFIFRIILILKRGYLEVDYHWLWYYLTDNIAVALTDDSSCYKLMSLLFFFSVSLVESTNVFQFGKSYKRNEENNLIGQYGNGLKS